VGHKVPVRALADIVVDPNEQFQVELSQRNVENQQFCLALTPAGLAVYEEITSIAFPLPKRHESQENTFLNELRDLFTPDWVVTHMASASQ